MSGKYIKIKINIKYFLLKTVLKYHRSRKAKARIYYENTSKIGCKNAKNSVNIVRK